MLTIDAFGLKPDRVYRVKEVHEAFRISRATLYRWIEDKRFPPGAGGCEEGRKRTVRVFPGQEIADWLAAGKIYVTEEKPHAN